MSGLPIVVTAAGYAALVNATNTGTLPVKVVEIGVTSTVFVADEAATSLPGEIKRVSTFGGQAVDPATIHVTLRDEGSDVYSMRGFCLYLEDGTPFALYGQADVILEKSAQAMMVLSADIRFANIDSASITFGNANFLNPPATETVQGVLELATDAEALAGADGTRGIVARALKYVLDQRLGAGAPSTFVKGLLNLATAALFRSALAIKGAALKDDGAGNGLDADLLDGQHGAYYRAYANLTDIPTTFAPSEHEHSAADITTGTLLVARGGTGKATHTAGNYLLGNGTAAMDSKTPAQVLAHIGAAAVVHSHAISAVNGLDDALAQRPVQTTITAQITAAINSLINGSPGALNTLNELAAALGDDANFAATVTTALAGKQPSIPTNTSIDADALASSYSPAGLATIGVTGSGSWPYSAGSVLTINSVNDIRTAQIMFGVFGGTNIPEASFRSYHTSNGGGGWTSPMRLWHDGNLNPSLLAPRASPEFTGLPRAPTAAASTNSTQLATTAFVQAAIAAALANYLPKNNPTFTGTMTGPAYNET